MRTILFFILLSSFLISANAQSRFSKQQVAEDLEELKNLLINANYDAYAYTTKAEFDSVYDGLRAEIKTDSLNFLKTTNLFQRMVDVVKMGHTSIPFPAQSYIEYVSGGGTIFPLELTFEDNKSFVRKNWSAIEALRPGTEILSINGMPMPEVLAKLHPYVAGEREYLKNAKIELFSFPRIYWQVFGAVPAFQVEALQDGKSVLVEVPAVAGISGYESLRNETLDGVQDFRFIQNKAYVKLGSFSGDEEQFKAFVDSAFTEIRNRKTDTLILDLRNNSGGNDSQSDYLLSYIADRPFRWNSAFSLKTSKRLKEHVRNERDTTAAFWKEALTHADGEIYDYAFEPYEPKPEEQRFTGTVYALINRQSHSQAAVTASQLQDYGWATLVGEETGDYPSLYASVFYVKLPQTGIVVQLSKGKSVRVNGSDAEEGVIPDLKIRDHLLDDEDEILEGLLDILSR